LLVVMLLLMASLDGLVTPLVWLLPTAAAVAAKVWLVWLWQPLAAWLCTAVVLLCARMLDPESVPLELMLLPATAWGIASAIADCCRRSPLTPRRRLYGSNDGWPAVFLLALSIPVFFYVDMACTGRGNDKCEVRPLEPAARLRRNYNFFLVPLYASAPLLILAFPTQQWLDRCERAFGFPCLRLSHCSLPHALSASACVSAG
jgi:hypothetical protein